VTITNVDHQLTPPGWWELHVAVANMMEKAGAVFHGEWFCGPIASHQSACWCIDVQPGIVERLKGELAVIGAKYGRGMIAWSESPETFILG
jgi:hypothetical protein